MSDAVFRIKSLKASIKKRKLKKKKLESELIATLEEDTGHEVIKSNKLLVDIAIPGSILQNAQSQILKTYLIGQIARAATIFKISNIILFNDQPQRDCDNLKTDELLYGKVCLEMALVLQYLECPQYLRRALFPHHPALQYVGLLNPLDSPHHLRIYEDEKICGYREGIIIDKFHSKTKIEHTTFDDHPKSLLADVGLLKPVHLEGCEPLDIGTRITVKLNATKKKFKGVVVSPNEPFIKEDTYWGYNIILCESLSQIFNKCTHPKGYDFKIGTSDKGSNVYQILPSLSAEFNSSKSLPINKRCLVVFGGVKGLESIFENDENLNANFNQISDVFDYYINSCPSQGTRTIRTEEAILITLSVLNQIFSGVRG